MSRGAEFLFIQNSVGYHQFQLWRRISYAILRFHGKCAIGQIQLERSIQAPDRGQTIGCQLAGAAHILDHARGHELDGGQEETSGVGVPCVGQPSKLSSDPAFDPPGRWH